MKKIAILGLHLGYGGVEQSIVNLANMLCDNYDVELVITYKVLDEIPYKINPKVKVRFLTDLKPNREEFKSNLKKLHLIKTFKEGLKSIKILKLKTKVMADYIKESDADIIISSRVLYTELVSKFAKENVITIAQEHCHHNNNEKYIKRVIDACRNIDYLMPVSEELTTFYKSRIKNNKTKCIYIPNSLDYKVDKLSTLEEANLISIGRLSPEKGFLDLIDVFDLVYKENPNWKLNIIGDGVELESIKQKIADKNLKDNVILHGFQNKEYIYDKLSHSSIYIMCSYEESFGIVLLEAASVGLPLLAFSSAQGAHEIIENNKNGYLIENRDFNVMANKINKLIKDKKLRKQIGENAKKSVGKYSFDEVKEKWLSFIKSLEG